MFRLTAVLDRFPWLKTAREVALFAYRRGREVRLQQVAGSLTFTTVLSIVPLFAVALALFSAFPLFAEFREAFQSMVQRTLPAQISSTVLRYVSDFAQQATRLTAAGLIFLGLAALAMIMTVDRVLNDIWQVRDRRPFSQRVLIYWALITLGPILIGASLTASSYLWALSEDAIALMPRWLRSLIDFAPVILSGLAYSALYVFVPNRTVRWRDALIGGFVAAILAELLKSGFAHYISRGAVRSIYGAFAALPLFLCGCTCPGMRCCSVRPLRRRCRGSGRRASRMNCGRATTFVTAHCADPSAARSAKTWQCVGGRQRTCARRTYRSGPRRTPARIARTAALCAPAVGNASPRRVIGMDTDVRADEHDAAVRVRAVRA